MTTGTGHKDRGAPQPIQFSLTEAFRRIHNMCRVGIVVEADYDAGKVRCRIAGPTDEEEVRTDWLPWAVDSAGNNRDWQAPEVGEQVIIISPGGDLRLAFVMGALNRADYPHESNSPDYRKTVYSHTEDDAADPTVDAIYEFNRLSSLRRWWLKSAGAFRWEIADKSCFILDAETAQLRVGKTQIVVKDGSIALQVEGRTTELLMDKDGLLMQTQDMSVFKMLKNEISQAIQGKAIAKMLTGLFEVSINKNGMLSVREDSISARLVAQKVRLGLFAGQMKAWVNNCWMRLYQLANGTQSVAELRVPGSAVVVQPASITLQTPEILYSTTPAPAGLYEPGANPESFLKPANSEPFETPTPPDWSTGKAPYRPVSEDTSGPVE